MAHPRERGEHYSTTRSSVPYGGSSPRARGAQQITANDLVGARLIPASAGSTYTNHLTMCHGGGSSPRARGAPEHQLLEHRGGGLIPASAGSTTPDSGLGSSTWAHPRERGEHFFAPLKARFRVGSSPRARGAPCVATPRSSLVGLIPASAGSTLTPETSLGFDAAHPRERGEHAAAVWLIRTVGGSSPRARGAHLLTSLDTAPRAILGTTCWQLFSDHAGAGRPGTDWPCSSPACHRRPRPGRRDGA